MKDHGQTVSQSARLLTDPGRRAAGGLIPPPAADARGKALPRRDPNTAAAASPVNATVLQFAGRRCGGLVRARDLMLHALAERPSVAAWGFSRRAGARRDARTTAVFHSAE